MPRMRLLVPLVLLTLGGCSSLADPTDDGAPDPAVIEARAVQVPVQSVRSVEIGRTRDGFLVTAYGIAPGLGYARPALRPRRGGAPGIDGYIEYDFVATEPPAAFAMPQGTAQARALRADLPLDVNALRGAAGIRVLGLSGGAQLDFAPPPAAG